ncbi:hypothetical protein KC317_g4880 [Hortaea werneckii]|nr:hypothetical protein KC317_g4880 [Hortaea werneckii]
MCAHHLLSRHQLQNLSSQNQLWIRLTLENGTRLSPRFRAKFTPKSLVLILSRPLTLDSIAYLILGGTAVLLV